MGLRRLVPRRADAHAVPGAGAGGVVPQVRAAQAAVRSPACWPLLCQRCQDTGSPGMLVKGAERAMLRVYGSMLKSCGVDTLLVPWILGYMRLLQECMTTDSVRVW